MKSSANCACQCCDHRSLKENRKAREFFRLPDNKEEDSTTDFGTLKEAKTYKKRWKNKLPIQHWREVVK